MFKAIVVTFPFPLRWEETIGEFGADEGSDLNLSLIRIILVLVLRIGMGAGMKVESPFGKLLQ